MSATVPSATGSSRLASTGGLRWLDGTPPFLGSSAQYSLRQPEGDADAGQPVDLFGQSGRRGLIAPRAANPCRRSDDG